MSDDAHEREAVERIYQSMRARVIDMDAWLSGDDRVSGATMRELLGYKPKRFANLCAPSTPDPIPRVRVYQHSQGTHDLREVAQWLYRHRQRHDT